MEPPEISYRTIPVRRDTIQNMIRGTGYFVYAEQHSIAFRVRSGRLNSVFVSYGDVVDEGHILAELETDNLKLQIRQQEIQVRKQELSLERKQLGGSDKFELEIGSLDLQLAQLQLQKLNNDLEASRLRSPMDGEVVYIANVTEGTFVDAYKTMFQIADRSQLYLSYTGSNISEFRLGMEVRIRIGDDYVPGEVIMTPAEFPYDAPDSQKRQIIFDVSNPPADVEKGDTAYIELVLERSEDTLIIPRSQVQHYMGRKYVYVLEDGVRAERNIETGIQTPTEVEVLEGLEENELVVLR